LERKDFNMIMVQATDSVSFAMDRLANFGIQSAPIISQNGIIGFVDVLDLVTFACTVVGADRTIPLDQMMQKFIQEFNRPVFQIMNLSQRDKWTNVPAHRNLSNFMRQLAKPNVHRITISSSEDPNQFFGITTQSSLLQFLWVNRSVFGERLKLKVADLWPESKPVSVIKSSEFVIRAFQQISREHVSGLAVVNRDGKLVGNISASDIKHAGLNYYFSHIPALVYDLSLPIEDFLKVPPADSPSFGKNQAPDLFPVAVKKEDTLERVLELLTTSFRTSSFARTHIHRVFVVDDEGKPIREISDGDVIAQFEF